MLKKQKILLGSLLATTLPLSFISCNQNNVNDEKELTKLREEYEANNLEYNNQIEKYAKELSSIQKEMNSKTTTDEKKVELKQKMLNLFFETKQVLRPLIKKYNFLLNTLREKEKNSSIKTIKLFHTNDEHGRIEYDNGKYSKYIGLLKIEEYLKDKEYDLLVSAGDFIQGYPLSDSDKGKTISQIAKSIGYDSVAIGNHELDFGLENILNLNKLSSEDKSGRVMPFISANIYYKNFDNEAVKPKGYDASLAGKRVFKPYIIKTLKNNLKVAIIGMTPPDAAYTSHPRNSELLEFKNPEEAAKDAIKEIKEQNPDINFIITTVHLGNGRNRKEWTSEWLLEKVQDIDLVIDGHSHNYVGIKKPFENRNAFITQTESYTKFLGDIDIVFDYKKGQILKVNQRLRNIDEISAYILRDSEELFKELQNAFNKENLKEIFVSPGNFTHITIKNIGGVAYWRGRVEPTELGTMVADSLAWEFVQQNSQNQNIETPTLDNTISLLNGGGVRVDLPTGSVNKKQLLALSPFGNRISAIKIKGSNLLEVFKHGASKGRSGGFAQWSDNVEYQINVNKEIDDKTKKEEWLYKIDENSIKINNKAINPEKYYYLVTNDFLIAGGDDYKMLMISKDNDNQLVYEGGDYLETLIKYAKLTTDSSKEQELASQLFAKKMNDYLTTNILNKKVVNFPQEALK